jgi:hypothetical protein
MAMTLWISAVTVLKLPSVMKTGKCHSSCHKKLVSFRCIRFQFLFHTLVITLRYRIQTRKPNCGLRVASLLKCRRFLRIQCFQNNSTIRKCHCLNFAGHFDTVWYRIAVLYKGSPRICPSRYSNYVAQTL